MKDKVLLLYIICVTYVFLFGFKIETYFFTAYINGLFKKYTL